MVIFSYFLYVDTNEKKMQGTGGKKTSQKFIKGRKIRVKIALVKGLSDKTSKQIPLLCRSIDAHICDHSA